MEMSTLGFLISERPEPELRFADPTRARTWSDTRVTELTVVTLARPPASPAGSPAAGLVLVALPGGIDQHRAAALARLLRHLRQCAAPGLALQARGRAPAIPAAVRAQSERLGIHRDTLRSRLERAAGLLGLDLSRLNDRVLVLPAIDILALPASPGGFRAHGAPPSSELLAADAGAVEERAAHRLRVLESDPRDLLGTVRVWLERNLSVRQTAQALDLPVAMVRTYVADAFRMPGPNATAKGREAHGTDLPRIADVCIASYLLTGEPELKHLPAGSSAALWSGAAAADDRIPRAAPYEDAAAGSAGQRAARLPAPGAGPPPGSTPPSPGSLSRSELRVLRYLPTHLSMAEIAGELHVSLNTVRTHMRHLYAKLHTHRRAETVDRARALGLLASPPAVGP